MFTLEDFQRRQDVTCYGFGWFPLPTVCGGAADAGFAAGADIVGLRETDINGFDLGGSAVSEVVDFIADGYLVVGLIKFVKDAENVLEPFGGGDTCLGRIFRYPLIQGLKFRLDRLRELFEHLADFAFHARRRPRSTARQRP